MTRKIIIFAKAPILGEVKTRLEQSSYLGKPLIKELYSAFLKDTIYIASKSKADRINIHYTPVGSIEIFEELIKSAPIGDKDRINFYPQISGSFSDKIAHSFKLENDASKGDAVIMIGADSPLIKPSILDDALDFIVEHQGMVVGPAADGGLYLLGGYSKLKINYSLLFRQGCELGNFVDEAKRLMARLKVMETIIDIDVASDLLTLIDISKAEEYQYGTTRFMKESVKILKDLNLKLIKDKDNNRLLQLQPSR
ncbi:MAG: TIGR04282 family arsenosugar biosynthesis glycosyltransferase [Nitrospinota bacterium]